LLVQLLISFGVILAAFLFISIKEIDNSTQQALQERQLVAQLMAERADNQMSYAQRVLENAIQDPDMDLDDGDLEPEKKLLQGVFEHSSLFKRVLLMNSSGIVTWLAPYTPDATRLIGVDMAAAPYNIPFSGATQPFFYEMLGVRTQTPGIALLLPIRSPKGGTAGYLSGWIDTADPRAQPLYFPYDPRSGVADLVNARGMILVSTQDDRVGQVNDHNGYFGTLIRNKQAIVGGCHSCHTTLAAERQSDVLAFAPLNKFSWGVALRQPESEVLAPTRALTLGLMGVGGLILIALLALIWVTTNEVVTPLRSLAQACQNIARGDLTHPVPLAGTAETLSLAQSFEDMRVALNKYREQEETYQHELERRVEQRTSELSQSRDYLMKTNRNLAALNAVAGILSRSLDLNEVLNGSLDRVLEAMGATAGGIFLLDAEESALVLMTQRGLPQEVAASLNRLSRQEIFHGKRTTAPRMGSPDWIAAGRKIMAERLQVNSFACVPLEAKGKVLGGLFLADSREGLFNSEDEALLHSIGWQIAMAVHNARLFETVHGEEQEREELLHRVIVAQEEERKRVARELHDETSQTLAALMLGLDTIETALAHDPKEAVVHSDAAKAIAKGLLENIRRITTDLRPTLLDDMGLVAAVNWYGQKRLQPLGIELNVNANGLAERRLPPDMETALFRIIQEAITNVIRHAQASRLIVQLEREYRRSDGTSLLLLQIADNGQGFDPARARTSDSHGSGLGLKGMQERIAILGGEFFVQAAPGKGTTITARVPIPEKQVGYG
jgi:signal transduction histidine kinase